MTEREVYLGDGLYASFDGVQIRLRAPREEGDHEVYLEWHGALKSFELYVASIRAKFEELNRAADEEERNARI